MAKAYTVGPDRGEAGPRIIRLAWTADDGPTRHTPAMASALAPRAVTWFVMNDLLGTTATRRESALAQLLARQDDGDEVAIHSMHPREGHAAWFPIRLGSSVPQAYASTAAAMGDLRTMASELRQAGLRLHFARMPGGELSEVKKYVEVAGIPRKYSMAVTLALLSGRTPPVAAPEVVVRDLALVRATLSSLGLHLWGGAAAGPEVTANSWEVESSGVAGRTNDVVRRFCSMADRLASGARQRPASFIVLAHDTTAADVAQAARNIQSMETYAVRKGVRVEYHNLSALYAIVRTVARQPQDYPSHLPNQPDASRIVPTTPSSPASGGSSAQASSN